MFRVHIFCCVSLACLLTSVHPAKSQPVGVVTHSAGSDDRGYVLFSPVTSDTSYLIDKNGGIVHTWASSSEPGLTAYLLPDGSLLRTGKYNNQYFTERYGSQGGIIERYDWDGKKLWSYVISDSIQTQDHDVCYLPNGNIIVVAWEKISKAEAIANGRDPKLLADELWSAKLIEIQPIGPDKAKIVWQWRLWDHLVQDFDATKPHYGIVADHPELMNLNYTNTFGMMLIDWIHLNAVTYNPTLNQVMISSHNLCEIYIIDHSTNSTQAAGHYGGLYRKGGDLLYRWGNPAAYNRGTRQDQQLFGQHAPKWIPDGYRYANKIIMLNNGGLRPGGLYSSVEIISPPVDAKGNYVISPGASFGPKTGLWHYQAADPENFFTQTMGSAQMLDNGNVLICEANKGTFFEIDTAQNVVWKYINPPSSKVKNSGGARMQNECAQSIFYSSDYPGFNGKDLTHHVIMTRDTVETPKTEN